MKTIKWYHYIFAIFILVLGPVVIGLIVDLIWSVTNFLSPRMYQSSSEWINLVSGVIACILSVSYADNVLNSEKPIFIIIFCFLFALLWILSFGIDIVAKEWWMTILAGTKLAVYIYYIVHYFKEKTIN